MNYITINLTQEQVESIKMQCLRITGASEQIQPEGQNGSPLGITVNMTSTLINQGFGDYRANQYRLQDRIQNIISSHSEGAKFRQVKACSKTAVSATVVVQKSKSGRAFYSGLLHCHSVWLCPVCSEVINRERMREISLAIDWAYKNGYSVAMVTQTHPHYRGQRLSYLMDHHNKAASSFRSGRWWQGIKKESGIIGTITRKEVTYGDNGWHYHTHTLLIIKDSEKLKAYKDDMTKVWKKKCEKFGFPCDDNMLRYGLDITFNVHSSSYLAKYGRFWGADSELTKSNRKTHGRHPFSLAASMDYCDELLFMEYAEATYRKKCLSWSRGLKSLVGVHDVDDEDIIIEDEHSKERESTPVCILEPEDWLFIKKNKARAEILRLAEYGGFDAIRNWLCDRNYFKFVSGLEDYI